MAVASGRENPSYKYSFAYEQATLYEYKFERQAVPDPVHPCYRCNRATRAAEQVDVGVLFHKSCFRCRICGVPLTAQTFYRSDLGGDADREIYCRTHVGKAAGEVRAASEAQQVQDRSKFGSGKIPSPSSSMCGMAVRNLTNGTSLTLVTPNSFDTSSAYSYSSRLFPHPKPILQSFEDFEKSGVFEAQTHLEHRHREEEERLQRFLAEEREKDMRKLDESIMLEKEQAASELLSSFEQLSLQKNVKGDLVAERGRIEEHFRRLREERLKMVMDKIASEEKGRSSKMIERQGQEMMLLIAEKDRGVDQNSLFDHSMRPPLLPPETKKNKLYCNPAIFEQLDKRSVELTSREYSCCTDIVRDLTRNCQTELEKARALFRWVIAKDLSRNSASEIIRANFSLSLLKGVRSGKETYHQLFKKLCSYAGLHCEIILGYSKGAGYKPGMHIEGNAFRNSWTAVAIDGSWRFINCTWAARHITGHKDELPQVFHNYDEFYFLTDPEDYIYQHYPDDPAWQLLEIPLPFSEFINLPVVKSPFFNYGLRFYSNYGATLTTDSGLVEIRLIMPKILGFGSLLEPFNKSSDSKNLNGRTLLRLVKNEAIFTVSLPRPGAYYFTIYTGDYWHSECLESACSFIINCKRLVGAPAPPYPPVPFFGPTPALKNLGIKVESHVDPLVIINDDTLEMKFKMDKNVKITHSLQYFDINDSSITDIDRYVFLRSRSDSGATYMVRCPHEGFYVFSLYAADGRMEASSLDCVYRYLIVCQEPNPVVNVFPKTYHRWQKCTLFEPLSGDLMAGRRYMFRLDVPQAVEVFVVTDDVWYHLKRRIGFSWEGSILMANNAGVAKVYARFSVDRNASLFSHMLDYELLEDTETEI